MVQCFRYTVSESSPGYFRKQCSQKVYVNKNLYVSRTAILHQKYVDFVSDTVYPKHCILVNTWLNFIEVTGNG